MALTAERILRVGATLGEGPAWIDGALWFVDIKGRRIHRFDPRTGVTCSWDAPEQVGWILPVEGGGLIVGLKNGVHRFEPESRSFFLIVDPEPASPDNRLNDAATDSFGRLWFGSMDDTEKSPTGRLYRLSGDALADTGVPPVVVTNGPAITADAKTLYHTDSAGRTIWRYAIHDDGTLGGGEPHIVVAKGEGFPDGSVIDSEGCLWVGLWAGWGVRRYDPAGTLMATVAFPCANVTKIAFGGDGLTTAYATTAHAGLDAEALAAQPLAGDLFAFDPGVTGLPVTPARVTSK